MPWNVSYLSDARVVETRYTGHMPKNDLRAAVAATIAAAAEHGTARFLSDCQKLLGGHTVVDLFVIVEELAGTKPDKSIKEAIILPLEKTPADHVRFWETACRNRGMDVHAFESRDQALEWLGPG